MSMLFFYISFASMQVLSGSTIAGLVTLSVVARLFIESCRERRRHLSSPRGSEQVDRNYEPCGTEIRNEAIAEVGVCHSAASAARPRRAARRTVPAPREGWWRVGGCVRGRGRPRLVIRGANQDQWSKSARALA